jgi:pentatricopeptide repeat protein
LNVLVKCGDFSTAEIFFSKMKKSVSNYGILMNGYNKANNLMKTLDLFNQMKIDGIEGDVIIYSHIIKALSQIGDFSIAESIVKQIPNSFLIDSQIRNALIDMWVSSNSFLPHFFQFKKKSI